MNTEKDLKFLQGNLSYLFQLFFLMKELHNKDRKSLGETLYKVLNSSLVRNFLLGLSNLLDPPESVGKKNISLSRLEIDLKKYEDAVKKIRHFRHKALAHNDQQTMHKGDDFFNSYGLTMKQTEELLEYMISFLEKRTNSKFPRQKLTQNLSLEISRLFN